MAPISREPATPPRPAVVVGVDDSVAGEAALAFGAAMAYALQLALEPVHVYTAGHGGPRNLLIGFADPLLTAHQVLDGALEDAQDVLADVVEVRPVVVRGHVVRELVDRSRSAAMVVVGGATHGSTGHGLRRPVSDHVVKHARCPVAVVPETWRPDTDERGEVVLAVEAPESGLPLLWEAFQIAKAQHRRVRLIDLQEASTVGSARGHDATTAVGLSASLQRAVTQVSTAFPGVEVELQRGAPELVARAGMHAAILLVGRRRHARLGERAGRGLGPLARRMLGPSSCPVIFADPQDQSPTSREMSGSLGSGSAPGDG